MDDWSQFPKLYSLFTHNEIDDGSNYFSVAMQRKVLKSPLAQERYLQLEKELSFLSETAWAQFRQKVFRYITVSDEARGYQQLFDLFNEVKGYVFLTSQGYKEIEFIEERHLAKTPDLIAKSAENDTVLLEIKTINRSNDELQYIKRNTGRGKMEVRDVLHHLPLPLLEKIEDTIARASEQLLTYAVDSSTINRRVIYLCINPDFLLFLGERNMEDLRVFCQNLSSDKIEIMSEVVT